MFRLSLGATKSRKRKSTSSVKIKSKPGGLKFIDKSGKEQEYHIAKSSTRRRSLLKQLIRGGRSIIGPTDGLKVFRRLNVLYLYRKNKKPDEAAVIKSDRDYIKHEFYGTEHWRKAPRD